MSFLTMDQLAGLGLSCMRPPDPDLMEAVGCGVVIDSPGDGMQSCPSYTVTPGSTMTKDQCLQQERALFQQFQDRFGAMDQSMLDDLTGAERDEAYHNLSQQAKYEAIQAYQEGKNLSWEDVPCRHTLVAETCPPNARQIKAKGDGNCYVHECLVDMVVTDDGPFSEAIAERQLALDEVRWRREEAARRRADLQSQQRRSAFDRQLQSRPRRPAPQIEPAYMPEPEPLVLSKPKDDTAAGVLALVAGALWLFI